ncbi:hypothetical protein MW290_26835 [Aquincola tertiaricarbonis]|uniref:DUF883 domain-containing protein n=1 Tax=Aquincola tertiaricarbonis TaxID=391953 RepID=A0ABY4S855_AQUTE|nr:hypothetical protein [Aquincola tertiaricarbonis]URI09184.1 hypothetical protein MW290_26835 [Aquincola tertiaricarbonis]
MVSTTSAAPAKTANDVADQAAKSADSAIRSTQRLANESLDQLSDKIHELRDTAVPAINRLASEAETLARRGLDTVRERSAQIRERAVRVSDNTVGYIKDEPVKSMLIAAATGAALMALVSLLSRSSRDD